MKNAFCAAVTLALILVLAGCTAPTTPTVPVSTPSPTETAPARPTGTLKADLFKNIDPQKFEQKFHLTIDAQGEQAVLFTDGTIDDLQIDYGTMDLDSNRFTTEYTLFSAEHLDSDSLVVISTYFPDVLSNIRIQYTGADGAITRYLAQSGKDGSILLTEN